MTRQETLALNKGRIPAQTIRALIVRWLGENDEDKGILALAARAGLRPNVIYDVRRGRAQSMNFNDADHLLIAMDMIEAWQTEELAVYYQSVDLSREQCQGEACNCLVAEGTEFCVECSQHGNTGLCGDPACRGCSDATVVRYRQGRRATSSGECIDCGAATSDRHRVKRCPPCGIKARGPRKSVAA